MTDGNPHDVYFEFVDNRGYISIDGQKEQFSSPRVSDRLDLHGHLYVGGLGPEINVTRLPRELWAAMLGLSYVGCLQDLVLNGNQVDLLEATKQQNKTHVVGYCRKVGACCSHLCFKCKASETTVYPVYVFHLSNYLNLYYHDTLYENSDCSILYTKESSGVCSQHE